MNPPEDKIPRYTEEENIGRLLSNLMASVVNNMPDDPRAYLKEKLSQIHSFDCRGDTSFPCDMVLTDDEISAIFKSVDTDQCGSISAEVTRNTLRSLAPMSEHANLENIMIPPYVCESVFTQLLRTVL